MGPISLVEQTLFLKFANPKRVDFTQIHPEYEQVRKSFPCVPIDSLKEDSKVETIELKRDVHSISVPSEEVKIRSSFVKKYGIKKFSIQSMKTHGIVHSVSKRDPEVTSLRRDILSAVAKDISISVGMSPTQEFQNDMEGIIPSSCLYEYFDPILLREMIKTLEATSKICSIKTAFVLHDFSFDSKVFSSTDFHRFLYSARYLETFVLLESQYTMDIPKNILGQIDYVFARRELNIEYRVHLWKTFFGVFDTFEEFSLVMDMATKDGGCLVIDNTIKSNSIEDCIFWYKPRCDIPPFTLANENTLQMHSMFYKPESIPQEVLQGIPILASGVNSCKDKGGALRWDWNRNLWL